MTAAVGLGVVALVALMVLVQPRATWRDAAEHSKRFWCAWALTFVTLGVVPALIVGGEPEGWALIWLLVCCAGAVVQPALWGDLIDVRRHRSHRHRVPWPSPAGAPAAPTPHAEPAAPAVPGELTEIRWFAPDRRPA